MWRLLMEMANVDRHSLADLDFLLLQTVDLGPVYMEVGDPGQVM